jgi:hypothetical protein
MKHPRSIALPFALLVASACETPAEPGADPGADLPDAVVSLADQGVVASATGSGHYTSGGELRTLSFNAVKRVDGSVSGKFHVTIHAIDRFFHVNVTCLSVRNDTAWVAGIIDKTDHPVIQEGTVSYFWAVDGGEGAGTTDKVSVARINDRLGEDQRFCGLMPDEAFSGLPGQVVEHGNVQVRGG